MFRLIFATILAAVVGAACAKAETIDGSRIAVVDGNIVALPCPVPGWKCTERLRIANIAAPEITRPACVQELRLGFAAKNALIKILQGHAITVTRSRKKDPSGQVLAKFTTEGGDVGDLMIAGRHAFPWEVGGKAKAWRNAQWCGTR